MSGRNNGASNGSVSLSISGAGSRGAALRRNENALVDFAAEAAEAAGLTARVDVLICGNDEIRELNRKFRRKDKATDVLSFPAVDDLADEAAGDIAISADIAAENATRFGHPLMDEVKLLIVHGMLHLAGYDHETDAGEMARKETALRRQLGLSGSLIERAANSGRRGAPRPRPARAAR